MSQADLIKQLIATPHLAQIIHQNGVLIFANTSAARIFGLQNVRDFVEFAQKTNVFASAPPNTIKGVSTRLLTFRQVSGERQQAQIDEQSIIWNGHPSSHLVMSLLQDSAEKAQGDAEDADAFATTLISNVNDDTYFRDSLDAAMDVSRTDSGALNIVSLPFDLAGLCVRLCDDHNDLAQKNDVELSLEISPMALKIFTGDANRMMCAASLIVRHAIGRAKGGAVKIAVSVDPKRDSIVTEVSDTGPAYTAWDAVALLLPPPVGNEPDALQKLDLPMAQCIAQYLGGRVSIKVHHSGGGLVRLKLPFALAQGEERRPLNNKEAHLPLKILVAEDNFTSQQVIKIILQSLGYEPTIVCNGAQCVEITQHENFDLIFMDLSMPVIDGYEATRMIRAREASKRGGCLHPIPILALTADKRPQAEQKSLSAGVTGFLTKPVHIPQILSALTPIIAQIRETTKEEAEAARLSLSA